MGISVTEQTWIIPWFKKKKKKRTPKTPPQLGDRMLAWKSAIAGVGRPGFCGDLSHYQAIRVDMYNRGCPEVAQSG